MLALVAAAPQIGASKNEADFNEVSKLRAEEEELLQEFGRHHPQVISVRKKLNLVSKSLSGIEDSKSDPVQTYLESLRRELADINSKERSLVKLFESERQEAQKQISQPKGVVTQAPFALHQQANQGIAQQIGIALVARRRK